MAQMDFLVNTRGLQAALGLKCPILVPCLKGTLSDEEGELEDSFFVKCTAFDPKSIQYIKYHPTFHPAVSDKIIILQ